MKTLLAALTFAAAAFIAAPSFAEDMMACDEANMMKTEEGVKTMKDENSMKMAMEHVDMAKKAMKDGKMDDCSMHMGEAMKATMMK